MNLPMISVIIPAYNREKTINYCLDSIIKQTYENLEVIVVDDGSQDQTVEMVNLYPDSRVKCISMSKNMGAQVARNVGIKNSHGEWIAFQDSDDEWLPNKLTKQMQKAIDTGADVIYCECYTNQAGEIKLFGTKGFVGDIYQRLLFEQDPTFPGLLVKKECLERIGYLDEDVPSYQEWDTSIRLAKEYNFAYCKEPLFIYHLHEGETISKNVKRGLDGINYIVSKHSNEMESFGGSSLMFWYYSYLFNGYLMLGEKVKGIEEKLQEYRKIEMDKFKKYKSVCIFGAGTTGKKCIKILKNMGKEILFFVDNYYELEEFEEFPVYKVNYLERRNVELVILASEGHTKTMRKQLNELNIKSELVDFNVII